MAETLTFNELRKIKDTLPSGSIQKIADELCLQPQTVRNYFGGANYTEGKSTGVHFEQGPDGGIVHVEDNTILEMAKAIIASAN